MSVTRYPETIVFRATMRHILWRMLGALALIAVGLVMMGSMANIGLPAILIGALLFGMTVLEAIFRPTLRLHRDGFDLSGARAKSSTPWNKCLRILVEDRKPHGVLFGRHVSVYVVGPSNGSGARSELYIPIDYDFKIPPEKLDELMSDYRNRSVLR